MYTKVQKGTVYRTFYVPTTYTSKIRYKISLRYIYLIDMVGKANSTGFGNEILRSSTGLSGRERIRNERIGEEVG